MKKRAPWFGGVADGLMADSGDVGCMVVEGSCPACRTACEIFGSEMELGPRAVYQTMTVPDIVSYSRCILQENIFLDCLKVDFFFCSEKFHDF